MKTCSYENMKLHVYLFTLISLCIGTIGRPVGDDDSQVAVALKHWSRCDGFPCKVWEDTQRKMAQIDALLSGSGEKQETEHKMASLVSAGSGDCAALSPEQATATLENIQNMKQKSGRHKRTAEIFHNFPSRRWVPYNPVIDYKFDGTHNAADIEVIRRALGQWQKHTCVRFIEKSRDTSVPRPHVMFTKGFRCLSYVGKVHLPPGVPQKVELGSNCLEKFGTVVHEIGHTLGLWHEQMRSDRDDYVTVKFDNIVSYGSQFVKRNTKNYTPYDYGSVMHYAGNTDSKNWNNLNTIEAKDPLYQKTMGQRIGLSFFDAKAINMEYCTGFCANKLEKPCLHGGYQDPNHCERCKCPDGFSGVYCDQLQQSEAECGGTIALKASGEATEISSAGYEKGSYNNFQKCHWLIKAPEGMRVQMTFVDQFGFYCVNFKICYHWLEVRYKKDLGLNGPRLCCYKQPKPLTSETEQMLLVMRAHYDITWASARRGFKAKLRAVSAGRTNDGSTTHKSGDTTSTTTTTTTPATTVPTTPQQTTSSTARSTTQTNPTVKMQTETIVVEEDDGNEWTDWTKCTEKCGGCGTQSRFKLCGDKWCEGADAKTQTRPCNNRVCTSDDKCDFWVSFKIYQRPCRPCCQGYTKVNGVCEKS